MLSNETVVILKEIYNLISVKRQYEENYFLRPMNTLTKDLAGVKAVTYGECMEIIRNTLQQHGNE